MIEVKNICKKFDEKEVLRDISFKFNSGETLAIVGSIKHSFFPILSFPSGFLGSIYFLFHFISLNH